MPSDGSEHPCCPLTCGSTDQADVVTRLIQARRIAVIGLSDDPSRPSFGVAHYLISVGKEIIPVNPMLKTVLGLTCHASLQDVPGRIDLVDVFRRAEFCPDIVREAIQIKAGGVWLQTGVISAEAEALARQTGMLFVQNRCLMVDHRMSRR